MATGVYRVAFGEFTPASSVFRGAEASIAGSIAWPAPRPDRDFRGATAVDATTQRRQFGFRLRLIDGKMPDTFSRAKHVHGKRAHGTRLGSSTVAARFDWGRTYPGLRRTPRYSRGGRIPLLFHLATPSLPRRGTVHPAQGNALGKRSEQWFLLRANGPTPRPENGWPVGPADAFWFFPVPRALPWAGRTKGLRPSKPTIRGTNVARVPSTVLCDFAQARPTPGTPTRSGFASGRSRSRGGSRRRPSSSGSRACARRSCRRRR